MQAGRSSPKAAIRSLFATISEVPADDCSSALTQSEVVLVGAAVVGIAFDAQLDVRITLQRVDLLIETAHAVFSDVRAIELEINRSCDRGSLAGGALRRRGSLASGGIIGILGVRLNFGALALFAASVQRDLHHTPLREADQLEQGDHCRLWQQCRYVAFVFHAHVSGSINRWIRAKSARL